MLAWILEYAGLSPGFLVGGVPRNFGISARLGGSRYFVVEADEYDTAFFDKRAKFVHYRPRTLVINNIEYDHADIYPSVDSILWQFHQLLRTVPRNGLVVANGKDENVERLFERGVWTPRASFSAAQRSAEWFGAYDSVGAESRFTVYRDGQAQGSASWSLLGQHNLENALAAIAAAAHVGVPSDVALAALARFEGVKRRLELRGTFGGVTLYEDFAHHPTAIATTLAGLRARAPGQRIVAVMEPRSNTMRMGVHREALHGAFAGADRVLVLAPAELGWDPAEVLAPLGARLAVGRDAAELLRRLLDELAPGDHVVLMSNGSFQGLPSSLEKALAARAAAS
jgi:UDP-N-acetylmuramate: L-alanyl-gamma-D-glutamyl-meso-diaminopimelate ligase